jgi:hypothetical protein
MWAWTNVYHMGTAREHTILARDRVYVKLTTDTRTGLSSAHLTLVIHSNSSNILALNVNTLSLGVFPQEFVYMDRPAAKPAVSFSSAPAGNGGGFGGDSVLSSVVLGGSSAPGLCSDGPHTLLHPPPSYDQEPLPARPPNFVNGLSHVHLRLREEKHSVASFLRFFSVQLLSLLSL